MLKRIFTEKQKIEIYNLYFKSNMSQRKIAKRIGCSQSLIGKIIKKGGYKARYSDRRGNCNPSWKGGRWDHRGYIVVYDPSHPHCNTRGYVREHRLVMEKYLGRYLKKGEFVHHINAIRDDNRIENLKLFKSRGTHTQWHFSQRRATELLQKDFCPNP